MTDASLYRLASEVLSSTNPDAQTYRLAVEILSDAVNEFYVSSITPNQGSTDGGTPVTIAGVGFQANATASIDGNALTDVTVVDSTTLIGITPAGTLGSKDVTVTNP
jgi:hypothetical protein